MRTFTDLMRNSRVSRLELENEKGGGAMSEAEKRERRCCRVPAWRAPCLKGREATDFPQNLNVTSSPDRKMQVVLSYLFGGASITY